MHQYVPEIMKAVVNLPEQQVCAAVGLCSGSFNSGEFAASIDTAFSSLQSQRDTSLHQFSTLSAVGASCLDAALSKDQSVTSLHCDRHHEGVLYGMVGKKS